MFGKRQTVNLPKTKGMFIYELDIPYVMDEQEIWENLFRINQEAKQGKLFNNLPSEDAKIYSEVYIEYTSTLFGKANKELTVEDTQNDINEICSIIKSAYSIKDLTPPHIYISDSPTATKEAILRYKGEDKLYECLNRGELMGLFWQFSLMHYEVLFRLGRIRTDQTLPTTQRYIKLLLKGVFDLKIVDYTIFITRCPRGVFFDEEGKLHRIDGPAIEWRDHRDDEYYIHGKKYTKDEFYLTINTVK